MKIRTSILLIAALFLMSCGKKEEPQTQNTTENQQQMMQNKQQNQQQVEQQKQTDSLQLAEKQKEESMKKGETNKNDETNKKKIEENTSDNGVAPTIDFAPIFQKRCAKCHGSNGKGKAKGTPDFTSASFKRLKDASLEKAITNGVKAENPDNEDMPAWKDKLSEAEIKAAVKYVKGL